MANDMTEQDRKNELEIIAYLEANAKMPISFDQHTINDPWAMFSRTTGALIGYVSATQRKEPMEALDRWGGAYFEQRRYRKWMPLAEHYKVHLIFVLRCGRMRVWRHVFGPESDYKIDPTGGRSDRGYATDRTPMLLITKDMFDPVKAKELV